jgi:hypothetical protein
VIGLRIERAAIVQGFRIAQIWRVGGVEPIRKYDGGIAHAIEQLATVRNIGYLTVTRRRRPSLGARVMTYPFAALNVL